MEEADQVEAVFDGFADALQPEVRRDVDRLVGFIECGIDFWLKAGEILVKMHKTDPGVFETICKRHRWVTIDMLRTLYDIGMKVIHPRVLLLPSKVAGAVAAMPYDAQKYVVESTTGVEVMREGKRRPTDMSALSRKEAKAAFSTAGIVPPELQSSEGPGELVGVYEISIFNGKAFVKRLANTYEGGKTLMIQGGVVRVRLMQRVPIH